MESYEAMQRRHADELALASLTAGRRDEIVRRAYANGMIKARIHRLSGVSRTTIDRILAAPDGRQLPEDVPACTRMDEDLPRALRALAEPLLG